MEMASAWLPARIVKRFRIPLRTSSISNLDRKSRKDRDIHELSLPELMHFGEEGKFPPEELDDSNAEEDLGDELDALVGEHHRFSSEEEELPHCESLEGSDDVDLSVKVDESASGGRTERQRRVPVQRGQRLRY